MKGIDYNDEIFMHRSLQLARNGSGSTSPNPMVGAVIVADGRIIGEGFHIRAGEPHAEVNAVRSVRNCDKHLLGVSTMYVTLEPCSHYGKTPPCCDLIISCGIPRVVIATTDFNSKVNGQGIARMRDAGIDVTVGVLSDEAVELNKKFFTLHRAERPFVTLKWAETADGFIDYKRSGGNALSISNTCSMTAVHKLRAESDAILVGTRTALLDNPSLTVRKWGGRSPLRLVIDRKSVLPSSLSLFDGTVPTIVYTECAEDGKFGKNVEQILLDSSSSTLRQIMVNLAAMGVNSLLVEGGAALLQSFIDEDLWDVARVERNPSLFIGDGVPAPHLHRATQTSSQECCGNEIYTFTK